LAVPEAPGVISLLLVGSFVALLLLGMPVVWAMGAAVILTAAVGHIGLPIAWLSQQLLHGADSITLSAIPLFLLAGGVMNKGGLTHRIVGVAEDVFGRVRGGLGLANVATALVYGGISGSATADTGAVAAVMIPAMEARGYPRDFSSAVTAASGTLGIIVPPSVVMILYGVITNTSIGGLFVAGILPGLMVCIAFMMVAYLVGVRQGFQRSARRPTLASFSRDTLAALPALVMPLLVLGSIVGGIATATEAAGLALVYALFVGLVVYRELPLRALPGIAMEALSTTGAIMMIMAVATPFAWILTVEQVPMMAANWITGLHTSPAVTIGLILLVLKVVGFWVDLGPALIILAPILQPIAQSAGFGQYQIGLLFIVTLGIGLFTPPIGTNIFVVCNVARIDMWSVSRRLVPFWAAAIVCVVLLAALPSITQWLPGVFGL
jgi:tripartite ATP-independent transporter DctM subunit